MVNKNKNRTEFIKKIEWLNSGEIVESLTIHEQLISIVIKNALFMRFSGGIRGGNYLKNIYTRWYSMRLVI